MEAFDSLYDYLQPHITKLLFLDCIRHEIQIFGVGMDALMSSLWT